MSVPPPLPAPLYQGSVNTWECDEGGHLNVRFHLERAMSGIAHMANALNLPRAFSSAAGSTLVPLEGHFRFLKEAHPGQPLAMHGGVIELNGQSATICLDMRHSDGAPASAFTFRVAHTDTRDFRAFDWSERSRQAARALACPLPLHAMPRSLSLSASAGLASRARAQEIGALRIGSAVITPDQCDAFGRLRGEHLFGRVSDSVPNLLAHWRREVAETGVQPAGAVVEARMSFQRWPRAGDLVEVHSGIAAVHDKTIQLVHWLCDPESGAAWATIEAVALTFDVATRKAIAPSSDALQRMRARVIPMRY